MRRWHPRRDCTATEWFGRRGSARRDRDDGNDVRWLAP